MHHLSDARQPPELSPDRSVHPYMPAIDGLRGIAILLVLWYHAPFLFRELPQFSDQQNPWASLGLFWVMSLGGWIGVDLFFVISGFLITLILIRVRNASGSSSAFWTRRALRIIPLAGLYLLTLAGLVALGDPLHMLPHFDGWAWYAFYLGNIHIAVHGWQPLAVMILWSLAIEEQFYVVWPLLVRMCNARRLLASSLALVVLAPFIRAFVSSTADYPAVYVLTFCRLDAFAAGAIIAVLFSSPQMQKGVIGACRRLRGVALAIVMITLLVPFSPSIPQTRPWLFTFAGYSVIAASFAVLLGASLESKGVPTRLLTSRALTFLGRRCYGLYLWHVLAAGMTLAALGRWNVGFYAHIALWLIILLAMAAGSWLLFEEPILRLKRFFPYQRTKGASLFATCTWTQYGKIASENTLPPQHLHPRELTRPGM